MFDNKNYNNSISYNSDESSEKKTPTQNNFPSIVVSKLKNSKNIFVSTHRNFKTKNIQKNNEMSNESLSDESCNSEIDNYIIKPTVYNKQHQKTNKKLVINYRDPTIVYIKNSNDNMPSSKISTYTWTRDSKK